MVISSPQFQPTGNKPMNSPKMRIYACGGAGVSAAALLDKPVINSGNNSDYASIGISYIDTSRSDFIGKNIKDNIFVIPGLDGQGQKRGEDLSLISSYVPTILLEHEPSEINLIIHSAGGGSGSVIGPLITEELLKRKQDVIVFMISCTGSSTETKNTHSCLLTYANYNRTYEKVIPISWHENNKGKSHDQVNKDITFLVALLAVAYSGNNAKLDSSDLKNWINYTKTTGYPAELSALKVHVGYDQAREAVSACSLLAPGQDMPSLDTSYHTFGYIPHSVYNSIKLADDKKEPISMLLIPGAFDEVAASLSSSIKRSQERIQARRPSSLGSSGSGIVL